MHFVDMEWLEQGSDVQAGSVGTVVATWTRFPRDYHDPRWKLAGYLPFRIEECYKNAASVCNEWRGEGCRQ